jgi:hypothetical protein
MKFKRWFKFVILLPILALLPLLIGQQPLSDTQLRQIIADWLGYPVDQIQFRDFGIYDVPPITVSPSYPYRGGISRVQQYEVLLPNNMVYYVDIDRYTGFIYGAGNIIQIPNLTRDKMLPPDQAVALARKYLQRYFIWGDTSNWEVTGITPKVENGQWKEVQPMISVDFEPPLQAPELPEGVEFINEAIVCSVTICAVRGDLVGFRSMYCQMDFPMEPFITPEEAENLARQHLHSRGLRIDGEGHWNCMVLAPEVETMKARLVYMFIFAHQPFEDEDAYISVWVGVDAHTGEIVYQNPAW